jgi:hypothetical protein
LGYTTHGCYEDRYSSIKDVGYVVDMDGNDDGHNIHNTNMDFYMAHNNGNNKDYTNATHQTN